MFTGIFECGGNVFEVGSFDTIDLEEAIDARGCRCWSWKPEANVQMSVADECYF